MSIIDKTYFTKDINIPDGTYNTIAQDILKYEPEILKRALGQTLYDLVATYTNPGSDQRIIDLVEGKEYTVEYDGYDHTVKWNGLKNDDKISLIAYYTYYWWQKNNATQTMYTGEVKPINENSQGDTTAMKLQSAWSRLSDLYGCYQQSDLEPSLYNFLTEFEDDYPEWIFSPIGSVNAFDL